MHKKCIIVYILFYDTYPKFSKVHVESSWSPDGVQWTPGGLQVDSRWTPEDSVVIWLFLWNPGGLQMDISTYHFYDKS